MLFVNFLCLLYLMLLVNGHTLSKNINDYYSDEKVDSLHDFEYTTRQKSKHGKFIHKHRMIKSSVSESTSKIAVTNIINDSKTTEATLRPQHIKIHKSTKRRIGGFWRKFKTKEHKPLQRDNRLKHHVENVNYTYQTPIYQLKGSVNGFKRPENSRSPFEKRKREITITIRKTLNTQNVQTPPKVNITPYENFGNILKATKYLKESPNDKDLNQMLSTITTKVAELKQIYDLERPPSTENSDKLLHASKHTATRTTTEEMDIPGTAQIEALLKDIKEKAQHTIAEQSPTISELISNTVTEATFEADPLLTHLEINSPEYSLYTFITLHSDNWKRDANLTDTYNDKAMNKVEITTYSNRKERSVKTDAMTAAQSIEDILQKEMKNIYKKVKNKVSRDFRKEVNKVKTTLKPLAKKICSKPTTKKPAFSKPAENTTKKKLVTTQVVQTRVDRKSGKHTKITEQDITTTSAADDYALLSLYEQMLAKTCQNNIMNMVTTRNMFIRKKRNRQPISGRNFETLFDQKLKDDVKKLYEDREEIPDELEYDFEINNRELSTVEPVTEIDYSTTITKQEETQNKVYEQENTAATPFDDNSYESLTSKISYKEFVNGYKHYLNFQKDLAKQNFSNLVRYQAHRHHSVDDIGKYILNKIPQLPPRDKRFLEYEDDHEPSTKSNQGWFKKHFYMFIENGTPRKYHTSQTISLKSPTPDAYDKTINKAEYSDRSELDDKLKTSSEAEDNAMDISLDKLSQVLEENKATSLKLPAQETAHEHSDRKIAGKRHHIFNSLTPHIINKVFGKDRRASLNVIYSKDDNNLKTDLENIKDYEEDNFLFENERDKKKRSVKYDEKLKFTTVDEKHKFQTKKSAKLINFTKTKKKADKLGCVDIDLVVPPTAIVKLKEAKGKKSKFKKLLHKLHLSRSNEKKTKRECTNSKDMRKKRSNPFQKLKNIFKSTPREKILKDESHLSDYEMITSHIDTFKPIKFHKGLNLEEMKKQIPNITCDPATTAPSKLIENSDISQDPQIGEKGFTDFGVKLDSTKASLPMISTSNFSPILENYSRYPTMKPTEKSKKQSSYDFLTTNVETNTPYMPDNKITNFPHHMALEDIRDQVEDMIIKITSDDVFKKYSYKATTYSNILKSKNNNGDEDLKTNDINTINTKIPTTGKYLKDDMIIKKNLENQHHSVLDLAQNSEFVENSSFLKTPGREYKVNEETTPNIITIPVPTISLLSIDRELQDDEKEKYQQFPDYFSDLLMWHKDILNCDKVPTPWLDILKNMNRESEYISPDKGDLQRELIKINDALNAYSVSNRDFVTEDLSAFSTNRTSITPRNWLHNLMLEKPPVGKRIFFEEEKKYVQFEPKTIDRHLKAADIVNELNKFAKNIPNGNKYKLKEATESNTVSDSKNSSVILVDTTLLSYDDDVNYVSTLTPRELCKNAVKFVSRDKSVASSQKAKTKTLPMQYFSTPLPMKMTDFEEFLKANKLDVESVTSPLLGLPTMNSDWKKTSKGKTSRKVTRTTNINEHKTTKSKTKPKRRDIRKNTISTVESRYEKESGDSFDYLDDLEQSLFRDYNSENKDRFKRYFDRNYDRFFMNLNTDTKKEDTGNTIMNKLQMDNKKPIGNKDTNIKLSETTEAEEEITPKDFEITIINFGDIYKLTDEYAPIKTQYINEKPLELTESTQSSTMDTEKTHEGIDAIEKDSKDVEFFNKIHNDFFNDHGYAKNRGTTTEIPKVTNIEKNKDTTPAIDFHEALLKKMPDKTNSQPKRVCISGQSYKYDIIYHNPGDNKKYRDTLSIPPYASRSNINTPEDSTASYNRDFFGQGDVARSDINKPRIVRKVKVSKEVATKEVETQPAPFSGTKLKKRHHKLKRLFPVIQGKFKKFSKNSSTPSEFLQKSATIIISNSLQTQNQESTSTAADESTKAKSNTDKLTKDTSNNYTNYKLKKEYKRVPTTPRLLNMALTTSINSTSKDSLFGSGNNYQDQGNYVEESSEIDTSETTSTMRVSGTSTNILTNTKSNKDFINKREIQGIETHTAKNVAALEVIVDMMKNPLKYDENSQAVPAFNEYRNNGPQIGDKLYPYANAIQVHIAVPCEIGNSKKRSLEPVKVRKVFSAKLYTPVDLEYQVHSYERPSTTEQSLSSIQGLSPGVYLLVDNTYFPQGVALQPVNSDFPLLNVRQVKPTTEKITSTIPTKNFAKVTLSKDFISAINKQLIQLYNLTTSNKNERETSIEAKKDKIFKRSLNWEPVKKLFGHDRVCHCKCRVNKTMCRACAASDAVMSELIFEFENLSKYMNDHCTEIQTYFWMNPSGGKRLKDSVHKIDQSLRDYYKRVKGKCRGRTCKTFATYIDKRNFHKHNNIQRDAGSNFISDLEAIATDLEKATKTVTCFEKNLKVEVNRLKCAINNCIFKRPNEKRSELMCREGKNFKNVYSLDNVNVNIICKTESTAPYDSTASPHNKEKESWMESEYKEKCPKGIKRLFSRFRKKEKEKSMSEYLKDSQKLFVKRAIENDQIESPLITDTGGSFWHDYIKMASQEPKFATARKPKIEIVLTQTKRENITNDDHDNMQTTSATKKYIEDNAHTNAISPFMKLFSTMNVRDVAEHNETTLKKKTTAHKTKTRKIKHKKTKTKIHKTVKAKMHNIVNSTNGSKPSTNAFKSKVDVITPNIRVTKTISSFKTKSKSMSNTLSTTTTTTNIKFFKKIKMITAGFFHLENRSQNAVPIKREHTLNTTSQKCATRQNIEKLQNSQNNIDVISEFTSEMNPSILIIDENDEPRLSKYKDLLLSIIDFESNKLNKEWIRFANINMDKVETNEPKTSKKHKRPSQKENRTEGYDILRDLQALFPQEANTTNTNSTKSLSILLDKIARKFKMKMINHENKEKVAEKPKSTTSKYPATLTATTQIIANDKEADDSTAASRLCNIEVTKQRILKVRSEIPVDEFENYVKNVTCQRYEPAPHTIFLGKYKSQDKDKKNQRKWSWIRDRRSLFRSNKKEAGQIETSRALQDMNLGFEEFTKGEHGIYKQKIRRKRCVESDDFLTGLRHLPRLQSNENEIYAMVGDNTNFSCSNNPNQIFKDHTLTKYVWDTERDGMLDYSNIMVDGDLINIDNVQPKNDGCYICKKGSVKRKIKLVVLTLPNFIWTSTLLFTKDTDCTRNDLKRIKLLGTEMSKKVFQRQASVTISDPVCLEERDGISRLSATVRVNCRPPPIDCTVTCRRDLQAAFAAICGENVPALSSIEVTVLDDGMNRTWKPSHHHKRSNIIQNFNDSTSQHNHESPKELTHGTPLLVISCPAGYRLLLILKVCAPCPVNTYSREGDNTCLVCPRGLGSTPGADRCRRTANRSRRYDWWMCPPCGYGVAAVVAVCCCGVCVVFALLVHTISRSCGATDTHKAKQQTKLTRRKECRMNLSPNRSSRVVFARFFKPSLTSSMATDSQETKFDMWKARNLPPPLPPVDFDSQT